MNDYVQKPWTELFPEIRQSAEKRTIPIISTDTAQYLQYLIYKYRPDTILEIGTAIGYSAMIMASTANFSGHITTLDSSLPSNMEAGKNIREYGFENQIYPILSKGIPFLEKCESGFDFIFIDGKKSEYADYFRLSKFVLNPGGLIVLDNLYWHGTTQVSEKSDDSRVNILREFNFNFLNESDGTADIFDIGDGVGVFKRK